jgi:8-amino-3,8-dideoxy-alpha-D-manno-octulosonate transaminase
MPGYEIIDKKEAKAVNNIFKKNNGVLFAHGYDNIRTKYLVRDFENQLSQYFRSKHALAVSSGTAAIKIALRVLGVKKNDEVITQSFNFIATIEAILDIGAKPIICSVDDNLNIDLNDLKKKINKKTKAIIPVHMLGHPTNINKIRKLIKEKNIKIVEDVCEAVGAKYRNKYLGTLGDIGIFSFDYGKTITTGEGGAILTNNKKLYELCRQYHDHGHKNVKYLPRGNDEKGIVGFNYRMTEMQAAVGMVQLKKLSYILKENKKRYKILENNLNKKFRIRDVVKYGQSIYDTFILQVDSISEKNKILETLKKNHFPTKNLPDAIKWHCSYFWDHALDKIQIKNSILTYKKLSLSIAIPILLKKNIYEYAKLSNKILKINL